MLEVRLRGLLEPALKGARLEVLLEEFSLDHVEVVVGAVLEEVAFGGYERREDTFELFGRTPLLDVIEELVERHLVVRVVGAVHLVVVHLNYYPI